MIYFPRAAPLRRTSFLLPLSKKIAGGRGTTADQGSAADSPKALKRFSVILAELNFYEDKRRHRRKLAAEVHGATAKRFRGVYFAHEFQ